MSFFFVLAAIVVSRFGAGSEASPSVVTGESRMAIPTSRWFGNPAKLSNP